MAGESSPPQPKQSLLGRILDLGNHNKLIAAATLITLATGAPYLVSKLVGLFSEEDVPAAAGITQSMIDEAIEAALARVKEDAGRLAVEGKGVGARGTAAASEALRALGDEVARPEATEEERARVFAAVQQYATGRPDAALAEFRKIAESQESRGALEAASVTWRNRATVRLYSDAAGALEDFARAESLDPGGPEDLIPYAQLQWDTGQIEAARRTMRRAILLAREAGSRDLLLQGLSGLSKMAVLAWALDVQYQQELERAREELLELLREAMEERPNDLDAATSLPMPGPAAREWTRLTSTLWRCSSMERPSVSA